MSEEIKNKLKQVLPHLLWAAKQAQVHAGEDGKVELGIIAHNKTGGKILASFEVLEFLADLTTLLEPSKEELEEGEVTAQAAELLHKFGLK